MPANIGVDQAFCRNPARSAKGLGRVIGRACAKADAAVLKRPDGGHGVNHGGNGLRLASIGECHFDGGSRQFTWGRPFASDGFPAGLTYANDHWRARVKIAHVALPIIS